MDSRAKQYRIKLLGLGTPSGLSFSLFYEDNKTPEVLRRVYRRAERADSGWGGSESRSRTSYHTLTGAELLQIQRWIRTNPELCDKSRRSFYQMFGSSLETVPDCPVKHLTPEELERKRLRRKRGAISRLRSHSKVEFNCKVLGDVRRERPDLDTEEHWTEQDKLVAERLNRPEVKAQFEAEFKLILEASGLV